MSVRERQATPQPRVGVLVVNFGEPPAASAELVEPFLERIFLQNAGLEPDEEAVARARALARDRAPTLVEEYELIGGSPLNAQADAQARALEGELRARNWDARTYSAFQFTAPYVSDRVAEARSDGVDLLVGLPVYPICGHSTTGAALQSVHASLASLDWAPRFVGVSGWHDHPAYGALRVDAVRRFVEASGLDLGDPDTLLYFSVHGTPVKYLEAGSRYDRYVDEHCREVARRLGVERYQVGFQNHTNRRVEWTQPDNEALVPSVRERRLVIVPISFMHEQSETLAELDRGLRAICEGAGKEYYRAPVPHEEPQFVRFLADLVTQLVEDPAASPSLALCRCVLLPGVWCTNGARDLPPSPFVRPAVR